MANITDFTLSYTGWRKRCDQERVKFLTDISEPQCIYLPLSGSVPETSFEEVEEVTLD
jgi:hypothetical protein